MAPFDDVVSEHGEVVLRVCRAIVGAVDADDVWSETFLAALRAYPQLPEGSNVRGWLVTIAHNKAVDLLRRRSRAAVPVATVEERLAAGPTVAPTFDEQLRDAVAALPPKQRAAVVYHYVADLPYAVVGELIDSSTAAARRSAADGIAALRTVITPEDHR